MKPVAKTIMIRGLPFEPWQVSEDERNCRVRNSIGRPSLDLALLSCDRLEIQLSIDDPVNIGAP